MTAIDGSVDRRGLPVELVVAASLFTVVAVEVGITYWRLDPTDLYHVSGTGLEGGTGRALVFLNYPAALVATGALLLLVDRLAGSLRSAAAGAIILCATVVWPGVVDPGDLDARPVNAIAATGIAGAIAVAALAWRAGGLEPAVRGRHARLRLVLAAIALALATPWLLADLGLYADGIPGLQSIYLTGALRTQPGQPEPTPAVHHGHHHGLDGTLLVWSALLLTPLISTVRSATLRWVTGAYFALMLSYGAANLANDIWLEQIVKRGWTNREIPNVTQPSLSAAWGLIVLGAAAVGIIARSSPIHRRSRGDPTAETPQHEPLDEDQLVIDELRERRS